MAINSKIARTIGVTIPPSTLPFGSRVTVTNPQNGRPVTVVTNDRGPFTRGVTLDLTRLQLRGMQHFCLGRAFSNVVPASNQ
jgi:hypothetical protein